MQRFLPTSYIWLDIRKNFCCVIIFTESLTTLYVWKITRSSYEATAGAIEIPLVKPFRPAISLVFKASIDRSFCRSKFVAPDTRILWHPKNSDRDSDGTTVSDESQEKLLPQYKLILFRNAVWMAAWEGSMPKLLLSHSSKNGFWFGTKVGT